MSEQQYEVGDGWICHTPDPNNYHDASSMTLGTLGRPMSAVGSRFGVRGIVLPRSSFLGGSRNKGIFKIGKVNIDPGYKDGEAPVVLDLSKVTEDLIENPINEDISSAEDMRNVIFKAFRKMAKRIDQPIDIEVADEASSLPLEQISTPASFLRQEQPTQVSNPAKRFEGVKNVARTKNNTPTQPEVTSAKTPTFRVEFELAGFGTIESSYHNVVIGEDEVSLVLVYDNSFNSGTKYFPPANDADIYVDVKTMPYLFKTKSAGLHYRIGHVEHYVLLIEERISKDEEE